MSESIITEEFQLFRGDCIRKMDYLKKQSFQADLCIFSPPFPAQFAYTRHDEDMGNSRDTDDLFNLHISFLPHFLHPLIKEGRNVCVHVQNTGKFKGQHGYIGRQNFRGKIIEQFEKAGFIYYSEVTIPKNPQAQSIRTRTSTLTFAQWEKDSMVSAPCLGDYVIIFKKRGDNKIPVKPLKNGLVRDTWIDWADMKWQSKFKPQILEDYAYATPTAIWDDIKETYTLNTKSAKDDKDERHMCPLQLDLIERLVLLYSNKGETVFSPYGGIGSEGYVALKHGRKSVAVELKESYYEENIKNLNLAIKERNAKDSQMTLF